MKDLGFKPFLLTIIFSLFILNASAQSSPQISSVQWNPIAVSGSQCINGTGFGTTLGSVTVSGTAASISSWTDAQVCAYIPNGVAIGQATLQLTTKAGASNTVNFGVAAAPSISSVRPRSAGVGSQVTITGTGFGATQGSVFLSGFPRPFFGIASWTDTQIVATVPAGTNVGSYSMYVNAEGLTLNTGSTFYVVAPPQISSVQWNPVAVAGTQCANGTSFGPVQGTATVNGVAAYVNSWTDTQVCVVMPNGIGPGSAILQVTNGAASSTISFSVSAAPVMNSIRPASAGVGAQVTVAGSGFGSTPGSVFLSGSPRPVFGITSWSDSQIVATVPAGTAIGTYNFYVTAAGLTLNPGYTFNVIATPQISSVLWNPLAVGGTQCVNGTLFGATPGTVTLNGVSATVSSWTNTQVCAVSTGVTPGPATLQLNTVAGSATTNFSVVAAPAVNSVHPGSAGAGSQVTITGTGLGSAQGSVVLSGNGAPVTLGIVSWSGTQIVASIPTGTALGTYNMSVTALGLPINTGSQFYVISPPQISAVQWNPLALGGTQCVTGTSFGPTLGTVAINGSAASVYSWTDTQVCAAIPAGTALGAATLQLTTGAGSSTVNFTVVAAPVVNSVHPITATVGTQVTITGTGFGSAAGSVSLNASPPVNFGVVSWSDNQIVATVPVGTQIGTYNMSVLAQGVAVNTGSQFYVIAAPQISNISPVSGSIGTQVTVTGSGFGATQGTSTITFHGIAATVTSWSDISIVALVPVGATPGNVVVTVQGIASNGLAFTVLPAPAITSLTPANGPVGTQVIISGSNFGASQGSGGVTFNGTTAAVNSWSDTSIVAIVPSTATSGNVIVTTTNLTSSNGLSFTIIQPLTIQAIPDRPSNAAGWYSAPVTVSFHCSGGLAPVNCPPSQSVSSDGSNQTIGATAVDAAGNTASANIVISLDQTVPTVSITTPADGTFINRSVARVTVTTSDTLSGIASVSCNGALGIFSAGSFVCNVLLVAGANPIQAQAFDNAGNTATSAQITVNYTPIPPNAIFITPPSANMLVGQTRTVSLVGDLGQTVSGATWSVSDSTIVSITNDDPPQLTAVAAGTATLTAGFGNLTATMTINVFAGTSLPVGTPIWSTNPASGNNAITQMMRANPINPGDPDIFAIQSPSTLVALTADGQQLWAVPVNRSAPVAGESDFLTGSVPDNNGGTVNTIFRQLPAFPFSKNTLVYLDSASQQVLWSYDSPGLITGTAIAPDNTVYATEVFFVGPRQGCCFAPSHSDVIALDGTSGQPKFTLQVPPGHVTVTEGDFPFQPSVVNSPDMDTNAKLGLPSVLPDGSLNLLVYTVQFTDTFGFGTADGCSAGVSCETAVSDHKTLDLLTIQPDGSFATQHVHTFDYAKNNCQVGGCQDPSDTNLNCLLNQFCAEFAPGEVIPDGNGGALAAWSGGNADLGSGAARVRAFPQSGGTFDYTVPMVSNQWFPPVSTPKALILGENNIAFGSDGRSATAFDITSGAQQWTFLPGDGGGAAVLGAGSDGGVMGYTTDPNSGSVNAILSFNSFGAMTSYPISGINNLAFFDAGTLLATTSSGQGEMAAFPNPGVDPDAAWSLPGSFFFQRATAAAHFRQTAACSGFDDTVQDAATGERQNWLMVGLQGTLANPTSGTKDVRLASSIGFDRIDLVSSDTTRATVARGQQLDHDHMIVTVTGLQPNDTTTITAVDSQDHNTVYAKLHLAIKPRITRTAYPFAVSNIDNNGRTTLVPTHVADSATLQARLEQIYGVQANIHFTVHSSNSVSVHYDLNGDGAVQVGGEGSTASNEVAAIATGIFDFYHCLTIDPNNPCSIDLTGFFPVYVHRLSQDIAIGFGPTSQDTGTYLQVIGDVHIDGTDLTTSHEIGHSLGLPDICPGDPNSQAVKDCIARSTHELDRIMWHFDGTPGRCRLREPEWQIIHKTLSSH